ncbi:MAG: hypothetical protein DRR06_16680, partial [Gammaproteobacteria bacterium]
DRHGDIVRANGWDVRDYKKNPVILWAHNHEQLPIGKSLRIIRKPKEKQLLSVGEYPSAELYEFANTAFRLAVNGFLNAVSVGFKPKEYTALDEEAPWLGYDIIKQELWEYSFVPIPANPNALQNAANAIAGGVKFVRRWAEEVLDTTKDVDLTDMKEAKAVLEGKKATVLIGDGNEGCEEFTEIAEIKDISPQPLTNEGIAELVKRDPELIREILATLPGDDAAVTNEAIDDIIENAGEDNDPVVFTLIAEPTFDVEESVITNMVADAVTKVTGRLIDREV